MRVLGIDTSNLVMSIAVVENNRLLGEYTTNLKKNHSIRLMPAISLLLEELGMGPEELQGVAVAGGPGSYTGIRIGLTTAKTMAWSLGIPLAGVSSLEAIAANASFAKAYICPLMDARRGQVYTALFNEENRLQPDRIRLLDEWLGELHPKGERVLFLGDDVRLHQEKIGQVLGDLALFGPAEWNLPRASFIARKGEKLIEEGQDAEIHSFAPQYLQLAEAEAKWLAEQKVLPK
ncbi:tRNA (adenosine(37)-N6)-threonylcarbamoyltransferase complex dimerization subunit type 1 TsaB [Ammoniphilus resinae]|uniref:tRNA threonylcarbamoyladenosine biosynthesis protein TsaB n=1 Tax=Ammoniphilus resinae TaxID=861532 RepID=A0ABS4GIR1_9BACL|nr:tRNA (adenosine(37)-N6)-threonylcarbamoyltransferase complex dimerization subunit type 1 TsaB [Ammoniphilus resinae]MBP1930042.1 tRNA threonylcarbamoyladenosine biosynthesis protein TsaB [Ammoniphilus resinae]